MTSSLMTTYSRKPVSFTHGQGLWLFDEHGKRYLDILAGIAVCGLGHAHPVISRTICEQASKLLHTSNIYRIESQEKLGARLCAISGMDKAFFCNSGTEANEAAIKLARVYGHSRNIDCPTVLVFENSFHGRTLAALTATGNHKLRAGFEPLVPGFVRAPFGDLETVRTLCASNKDICAILVEPIQGEGGIRIADPTFLPELRKLCDEFNLLLMLDEIQTGVARTGHWYACQYYGVSPDVITTAKGLGNGFPVGACLAAGKAADLFGPGMHGTTFGGNPLACTTALSVLETIEAEGLLDHVNHISQYFLNSLRAALDDMDIVKEIRGVGLLIGIELHSACAEIVDLAIELGLLVNVTADNVIRILPPLILNEEQADTATQLLQQCIQKFAQLKR